MIDGQSSLHEKVDKIESMIRSMQTTTPRATTPPSGGSSVKYANSGGKSPKQPPSQTSKGERPQNSDNRPPTPQRSNGQKSSKQYAQPFENRSNTQSGPQQWTPSQQKFANSGRITPQQGNPPFNQFWNSNLKFSSKPRKSGCWICGQQGCHSSNHQMRTQTPPPDLRWNSGNRPRTTTANQNWNGNWNANVNPQQPNSGPPAGDDTCWTCGNVGCRSRFHTDVGRWNNFSAPSFTSQSQQGNVNGTRPAGNRGPKQPARPASR